MNSKTCAIDGCSKPALARGWCASHYRRWKKYGDPSAGFTQQTPAGHAMRYFREVVLTYTGTDCKHWPFARNKRGYGCLCIDRRKKLVSRLVCEAEHGPPPSPAHEAAHSCGKGHEGCCSPKHMKWATREENGADKLVHGTHNRGEKHCGAKLTVEQVLAIRSMKGVLPGAEIAAMYGVSVSNVSAIQCGKAWAWILETAHISDNEIVAICTEISDDLRKAIEAKDRKREAQAA